jgi:hypothetical protein
LHSLVDGHWDLQAACCYYYQTLPQQHTSGTGGGGGTATTRHFDGDCRDEQPNCEPYIEPCTALHNKLQETDPDP